MFKISKKNNVTFIILIAIMNVVLSFIFKFSYDLEMLTAMIIVYYLLFLFTYALSKKEFLKPFYESLETIVIFMILGKTLVLFSYLLTALNLPLQDNLFGSIDKLLGFNWHSHQEILKSYPAFFKFLQIIYENYLLQIVFIIALYSYHKNYDDLQKIVFSFMLTSFLCIIISVSLPAWGGYFYHLNQTQDLPTIIANYARQNCDTNLWCDFFAIREGSYRYITFKFFGLMTFPSFHAAGSTLMMLYFLRFKYLNIITTVLNVFIIYSAIGIGMHHLIDIIAGTSLAIVVYYAVFKQGSLISWWNVKAFRISSPISSSS